MRSCVFAVIGLAAVLLTGPATAVQADPGEVYRFHYDFTEDPALAPYSGATIHLDAYGSRDTRISLKLFDSLGAQQWQFWYGAFYNGYFVPRSASAPWTSQQGWLELMVMSGEPVDLNGASMSFVGKRARTAHRGLIMEPVPVPAAGFLLLSGLTGLWLLAKRRRQYA